MTVPGTEFQEAKTSGLGDIFHRVLLRFPHLFLVARYIAG